MTDMMKEAAHVAWKPEIKIHKLFEMPVISLTPSLSLFHIFIHFFLVSFFVFLILSFFSTCLYLVKKQFYFKVVASSLISKLFWEDYSQVVDFYP